MKVFFLVFWRGFEAERTKEKVNPVEQLFLFLVEVLFFFYCSFLIKKAAGEGYQGDYSTLLGTNDRGA